MASTSPKVRAVRAYGTGMGKLYFPIIFGSAVLACCIAFYNRRYFLRNIREEAASLYKEDVESTRMLEEFKLKYNAEKNKSLI